MSISILGWQQIVRWKRCVYTHNGLTRLRLLLRSISCNFSLKDKFSTPASSSSSSPRSTIFFFTLLKRSLLLMGIGALLVVATTSCFQTSTFVDDFLSANPTFPPPIRCFNLLFNSDRKSSGKSPTICLGLIFSDFSSRSSSFMAVDDGFSASVDDAPLILLFSSHLLLLLMGDWTNSDALIKSTRPARKEKEVVNIPINICVCACYLNQHKTLIKYWCFNNFSWFNLCESHYFNVHF